MSLAFGEFKFAHFELKYFDNHRSGLDCPACYKRMHSIMCDGNHKLYRWDRAYEEFRECYYGELLLYSDADVQESLAHLDLALGNRRPDTCCGSGQWKAARDSKSAIRGQTETGSVLCGCRHQFAMKGVNMQFSGERYGYAYYLDRHFMQAKKVDFIWQDIICKYWEWRKKALEKSGHGDGAGMRPALNLMHGKLHSWECQVIDLCLLVYPSVIRVTHLQYSKFFMVINDEKSGRGSLLGLVEEAAFWTERSSGRSKSNSIRLWYILWRSERNLC